MILELTRETNPWSVRVTVNSRCFENDHFIREYWSTIPRSHFTVPDNLAAFLDVRMSELAIT